MIAGKWPAIVKSVDRARREVRVEIPGLTDGAGVFPLAQIAYQLGDRSEATEIRVLAGDRVWVEFEQGDPRYPIITHYRARNTSNEPDTRRIVHDKHERIADVSDIHDAAERDTLRESGRDEVVQTGRNLTVSVAQNESHSVAQILTLTAGQKIRLEVDAGNYIEITAGGVKVAGTFIDLL